MLELLDILVDELGDNENEVMRGDIEYTGVISM